MTAPPVHAPRYREWILDELAQRKTRNPAYSLRAFAKHLGISKTTLSDVLAGKRHLSRSAALKLAAKLEFSPAQKTALLLEIQRAHRDGPRTDPPELPAFLQLEEDQFRLISEWYYVGVLTLAQLGNHRADAEWISGKLGISKAEADSALVRLARMGLVEIRGERLIRTTLPIATTHQVPSAAVRKYHRQNLKLAEGALEEVPLDRRNFSSISFPVDPKDLAKADRLIQEFKVRMAEAMESRSATEIYTLSVQLFPLTKEKSQ